MKGALLGLVIGVAVIFGPPAALIAASHGTPSTCIAGRTCDPTHDTLNWDGTTTHYGAQP